MKITKVTPYSVNVTGWRNYNFVRVDTDEGIYGVGEAFCAGPDKAWQEVVTYFGELIKGQDAMDRERVQQYIVNISRFPAGMLLGTAGAAIELALWDIAGKVANLPVYQLMGKVRDKVPLYTHLQAADRTKGGGSDPKVALEMAQMKKEKYGYFAAKVMLGEVGYHPYGSSERLLAETVGLIRQEMGEDYEIGVEMMTRSYTAIQGLRYCKAIEPYRPMFAEEVIRPDRIEDMVEIAKNVTFPIATGEQLTTLQDFERLIRLDAASVLQPEILILGFATMRKVAALAEPSHKEIMPHNPLSPLANCINVHYCMCTPNAVMLESEPRDASPEKDLVTEFLPIEDGYIRPNEKPGWGMDLNYELFEQHPMKFWARNYVGSKASTNADGSVHPL